MSYRASDRAAPAGGAAADRGSRGDTAPMPATAALTCAHFLAALDWAAGKTVLEPADRVPGSWVGAPSAVADGSTLHLAYRLRRPVGEGRGYANIVADWTAAGPTTQAVIRRDQHAADSLERPCLIRTDTGWRLYISCATPGTRHWRVDVLAAPTIAELPEAPPVTVLPGDASVAVKDPVIRVDGDGWHLWASCHPLDDPAATDRMTTEYATSPDGVDWTWRGTALTGSPGWDARGVRFADVLRLGDGYLALYDGRANEQENWEERTGAAVADSPAGPWRKVEGPVFVSPTGTGGLRYLSAVDDTGGVRLFYESARADGSHELRTQLISRTGQG